MIASAWPAPTPASWRERLLAITIALFAVIPFLDKALHIDDVLYLEGAYRVLRAGDPYYGVVLWDAPDGQPADLYLTDHNPPLWKYLLAAVVRFWAPDRQEWKLHAFCGIFVVGAALGAYELGRRFTGHPLWATAMIVWSPFFLPGVNLMLEAPLACFSFWSLALAAKCWEGGESVWAWLGGALAALAFVTKYTGGLLIPILFLGAVLAGRTRALVALVLPLTTVAGWIGVSAFHYGTSHVGALGITHGTQEWGIRPLLVLRVAGAVSVIGPALLFGFRRRNARFWLGTCGIVGVSVLLAGWDLSNYVGHHAIEGLPSPDRLRQIHGAIFSFHGSLIAIGAIALWFRKPRSRPREFLILWMATVFVFDVCCVPFAAVRHLLLFLAPATWLAAGCVDDLPIVRRTLLFASAGLGFALAAADYEFANSHRRTALEEVGRRSRLGSQVWFTGNWGFAHYAREAGAAPLLREPERYGLPIPKVGDPIVRALVVDWLDPPPRYRRQVVDHGTIPGELPWRTIGPGVHYYKIGVTGLPWMVLVESAGDDAPYRIPPLDDLLVEEIVEVLPVLPD